jgi:hypothetical protein
MPDFKYDLAFSLLAQDEEVVREIVRLLPAAMTTFFFPDRQRELSGKDGLDEFSSPFGLESRAVAIMHRKGWGATRWTAIEAEAIKSRYYREMRPDFLTLVKLDSEPTPIWFPQTRIWADLPTLGVQGVAAVLSERVRFLGGITRDETALELSTRVREEQRRFKERMDFLHSEAGVQVADRSVASLNLALEELGATIGASVARADGARMLYLDRHSVVVGWRRDFVNTLSNSGLSVEEWQGRPNIGGTYHEPKDQLAIHHFQFDQPTPGDSVWRHAYTGQLYSTTALADWIVTRLLERVRSALR